MPGTPISVSVSGPDVIQGVCAVGSWERYLFCLMSSSRRIDVSSDDIANSTTFSSCSRGSCLGSVDWNKLKKEGFLAWSGLVFRGDHPTSQPWREAGVAT